MKSTPIKDVSSVMNLIGNRANKASTMGTGSAGSFDTIMNKASGSREDVSGHRQIATSTQKEAAESKAGNSSDNLSKVKDSISRAENNSSQKVTDESGYADKEQTVKEAACKLVEEIAEKLGISEEDVLKAMELLGLDLFSLFQPENLTQLVLTLSGESEPLALLTNGELYQTMQELLNGMGEIKNALMETLSLTPEEFTALTEEMRQKMNLPDADEVLQNPILSEENTDKADALSKKEAAGITVTVDHGSDKVEVTMDESGNVKQVEGTVTQLSGEKNNRSGNEPKQNGAFNMSEREDGKNLFQVTDALVQDKVQTMDEALMQSEALYGAEETQENINQILDYMKLQLKPGMDSLEMQLHPESLGRLFVQLTAKGGEITAQFHVQNEAVKAVVESQMLDLKEALKEQGVKVEAVEVTVESHAFESNLWQGKDSDGNTSYQEKKKSPRRINLNALEEGFEEEAEDDELLAAKMMEANGNTVDFTA